MAVTWAQSYWHGVPVMKARIEEVAKRCRPGVVLDVGCNDGQLSQCLSERPDVRVVGVDIVQDHIRKAVASFPTPDFIVSDARRLPFADDSFDTVVLAEVLEHLGRDQGAALWEAQRVAKGHLIWTVPVGAYWMGEQTHQWRVEGVVIDHDTAKVFPLLKHIAVLEWVRERHLTQE